VVVDEARRKQLVAQHRKLFGGEDETPTLEETSAKQIEDAPVRATIVDAQREPKPEPTVAEPESAAEQQAAAAAFEERQSEWQRLLRAEQEQERLREELEAEDYGEGREPWSSEW
jgi:hypothetical protein